MININSLLSSGLVVSCQATADSPLRDSYMMATMALAAALGGAIGIRANGTEDIAAIHAVVSLPIIGIDKQHFPNYEVYITPTLETARQVVNAGASLVALDATKRLHPGGISAFDLIQKCRLELNVPVMADISTFEEAMDAVEAGADLIATTLVGYTSYSHPASMPDFDLISQLVRHSPIPIVVEGRVSTPDQARHAFDLGAYAVVIGAAITQPQWITRQFVNALFDQSKASKIYE